MRILALLLLSIAAMVPTPGHAASSFCKRLPIDPEVPAGLVGDYEVIGKRTGASAYSGTVTLGIGRSRYRVLRTVDGRKTYGTAWFADCGADKIRVLIVRLESKPASEMTCYLSANGDNYNRLTCDAFKSIEAWFQRGGWPDS